MHVLYLRRRSGSDQVTVPALIRHPHSGPIQGHSDWITWKYAAAGHQTPPSSTTNRPITSNNTHRHSSHSENSSELTTDAVTEHPEVRLQHVFTCWAAG